MDIFGLILGVMIGIWALTVELRLRTYLKIANHQSDAIRSHNQTLDIITRMMGVLARKRNG